MALEAMRLQSPFCGEREKLPAESVREKRSALLYQFKADGFVGEGVSPT